MDCTYNTENSRQITELVHDNRSVYYKMQYFLSSK